MAKNVMILLCVAALVAVALAGVLPDDSVVDTARAYCGKCCGYDIYCNLANPFILQDKNAKGVTGKLSTLKGTNDDLGRYFCFSCCGYDWYCNN